MTLMRFRLEARQQPCPHCRFRRAVERVGTGTGKMWERVSSCNVSITAPLPAQGL
jgi:hypothetical protein